MADLKPSSRERVKEIVASIEQNIQELFQSEKYFDYLRTMSRFHTYSLNNTLLIHMQRPEASMPAAGFNKWKQMGRHVKKGEKGLTIIAPTPLKKKIEEMRLDPDTKAPVLDPDGNIIMDEKTVEIPLFKPVKVFTADQTDGKPLPSLTTDLTGDVQQYKAFMEALRRTSPMPISFAPLEPGTDGLCSFTRQTISIREGMSQVQTVCAAVHEIGHAVLHDREKERLSAAAGNTDKEPPKAKDKNTMEVEAESVSFAVCQYYGIDTSANSMGYIAGWSKDRSLPELKASLETITKTVNSLICTIDKHFAVICKERGIDLSAQPERSEPDTPEKYTADFFNHLDELYGAGILPTPVPYSADERKNYETLFLTNLKRGDFSGFRHVLKDIDEHATMPTTTALRERLEKLSDQWDAALVCKIEPIFGADSTVDHSTVQTYHEQDSQMVPFTRHYHELSGRIKAAEKRMAEIAVLKTHIINYSKTRDTYVAYRKAGYSKKFKAEHESEILLHQAAKKFFDESGMKKLPTVKSLQAEYAALLAEKKDAYADYRKARDDMKELLTVQANVQKLMGDEVQEQKKDTERREDER